MGQSEVVKMKSSAKLRMMSIMSEVPPFRSAATSVVPESRKDIKREIATPRHILDRIGNQPRRLVRS